LEVLYDQALNEQGRSFDRWHWSKNYNSYWL